jgi:hypothetical protein
MSLINALRRARPQVSQKSRQLRGCRGPARICVAMLSKQNQQLVALTVRYYPPGGVSNSTDFVLRDRPAAFFVLSVRND